MSMKSLITGIQTSLKNAATLSSIADADIVIVPDEFFLPLTATLPAIGLKDGPISMSKEATSTGTTLAWEVTYQVHVILYVDIQTGEIPVIGQTSPAIKGTLDYNDLIRTVLHENYQSVSGVLDAYCVAEGEGELMAWNDTLILKKVMTFEYFAVESL
jgi:hypothetical protein